MPCTTGLSALLCLLGAAFGGTEGQLYLGYERFGVAYDSLVTGAPISTYDYRDLGQFGWYLDGQASFPGCLGPLAGPLATIERIPVVARTPDAVPVPAGAARGVYDAHPTWYPPRSVWMVGHELGVDSFVPSNPAGNDRGFNFTAYATAYHDWYAQIKAIDPTFRVMLGAALAGQDTGVGWDNLDDMQLLFRKYYQLYGQPLPVDVFDLRLFIDPADPQALDVFRSTIRGFRLWLTQVACDIHTTVSYRNCELWLSGYGVHTDGPGAVTRQWMTKACDWLMGAGTADFADPQIGLPADANRLVQRWAWFTLDDPRPELTASRLFYPNGAITSLGRTYSDCLARHSPEPATALLLLAALALRPRTRPDARRNQSMPESRSETRP